MKAQQWCEAFFPYGTTNPVCGTSTDSEGIHGPLDAGVSLQASLSRVAESSVEISPRRPCSNGRG